MKHFFKENFVLVAGITLPLALALVFFIATRVSVMGVEKPTTAVIFTTGYYQRTAGYNFQVENGQLTFSYSNPAQDYNQEKPRLFIYEPDKDASREIELPSLDTKEGSSAIIEETGQNIDTKEQSPDGFTFEAAYSSGRSNIMTDIFGGGSRYRDNCVLRKGGYRHDVPQARDYSCRFIGWYTE
ncbi:MAG: hypothetical protein HYS17_05575 [Micavibrio aeruginosavorus]|uniref:Uncharacterized protein n=1 Tax=Micavibrio aeruginosavorus TaxID=349221 RepID=A0A7T5UHS7_9BACT|nr:MAG: hypothetical protein HYS17_05575 [Micavibrio aeruginosavorus]